MKIIFTGKMGSGKTVLANYLVRHHGFTKIALADPMKEIEADIELEMDPLEITNKHMGILDEKQKAIFCQIINETKAIPLEKPKPRKRLQFLGTDGARVRIANDIWIRLAEFRASKYDKVAIDDVRFSNEFDYFKLHGWICVAVTVDPQTQWNRLTTLYGNIDPAVLAHASEAEVESILIRNEYDYLIDTSKTTDEEAGKYLLELLKL